MEQDPDNRYKLLLQELLNHNPDLSKRKKIIVRTKIDTRVDNTDWVNLDNEYLEISSVSGTGIPELIRRIGELLDEK